MSPPAIRVSGLSKLYKVGARQQGYKTLRETIADACWAPLRKLSGVRVQGSVGQASSPEPRTLNPEPSARLSGESFWALQDVSFDVQPGEVVGIIGRNGAGKSTLLKILSRITEPTSGRIELRGRVGSLLEVGTGFHPELTGRENIYMNGSILGMSRREIAQKFDEIVDFAEVEDFLDTPVKRYSSGMYVRLAFAVAAHLEPEILIVDEVLAVGDAEFQRKCLGKMKDVARHGRTVLFVSHNLGALRQICKTGVLLSAGQIVDVGEIAGVCDSYIGDVEIRSKFDLATRTDRSGAGAIRVESVQVLQRDGSEERQLVMGKPAQFEFTLSHTLPRTDVSFVISDKMGVPITAFHTKRASQCDRRSPHSRVVVCRVTELPLLPGTYFIAAAAWLNNELHDHIEHACQFVVENGPISGRVLVNPESIPGSVFVDHLWE